jgi:hypothetical protein
MGAFDDGKVMGACATRDVAVGLFLPLAAALFWVFWSFLWSFLFSVHSVSGSFGLSLYCL